jgi:hypothetical protein
MDPRLANKGEYNFGERSGEALPNNPGVYYHPQADRFVETAGQRREDGSTAYFENSGRIQADAFTQIGYRPATKEELMAYEAKKKDQEKANRIEASRVTTAMSSK